MPALPDPAYAAALASLSGVGPKKLRTWLDASTASVVWGSIVAGQLDRRWRQDACRTDVAALWEAHSARGIDVVVRGRSPYPECLAGDAEAPAVLFALGDPEIPDRYPRAAIVGTRTATRYGLGLAAQLGSDLAVAGVAVVSGLALGIDGAAHEGAVAAWESGRGKAAPPVAVVAGGLDSPYPRRHGPLWRRVAAAGTVLSEAPVGAADLGWRFPQRNRILAALADVVVVVECHATGGSLHTVRAATRRGIAVGAVPGSVRSPASSGTNDLLADGCFVVRDATDVLVAIGLARAGLAGAGAARTAPPQIAPGAPGIDPPVALPVDPPAAPLASLPVASAGRLVPSGSG
ncbi:MAG: DNA-processing protein DprA, partial [Acidimicrobiales bacterium]